MNKPLRPQLTPMVLLYALFDILGMVIFATGGAWFSTGRTLFVPNFPTGAFEAILAMLSGIALMIWAAARILRELMKRPLDDREEKN
jgi:membrane protein implicated in regulation of membrane protease activity